MNPILEIAINSVQISKNAFCKFISANDAGKTGAHQQGFYIPKNAVPLMFDEPGVKGSNKEKFVTIKWQGDFETNSRFIYYGQGTRNEYRLTRFGTNFPFLNDDNVGDLFILNHIEGDYYEGFVLQKDEDIEEFFTAFNLSSSDTNSLIDKSNVVTASDNLLKCFKNYLSAVDVDFPSAIDLAFNARNCYLNSYKIPSRAILHDPDKFLLDWVSSEYQLFKLFENDRYKVRIEVPFTSVEELVTFANTILNRRKSRAGKSLENHLSEMFNISGLRFESQSKTEDNKRPDFLFPDKASYLNKDFDDRKLICLASKTTCKDRWRQILNEADRIKIKHLFTLQQGISANQLNEMYKYDVVLVVPKTYIPSFPEEFRKKFCH